VRFLVDASRSVEAAAELFGELRPGTVIVCDRYREGLSVFADRPRERRPEGRRSRTGWAVKVGGVAVPLRSRAAGAG